MWMISIFVVVLSNIFTGDVDPLTLTAAIVGVTSLIFAAKGHVIAPVLMIVFSCLYGVISFRFHYWGEMITYLGMTLPMTIWALVTWYRNPSKQNKSEVEIRKLTGKNVLALTISAIITTGIFYVLLLTKSRKNSPTSRSEYASYGLNISIIE